jgi:hypothetical protein
VIVEATSIFANFLRTLSILQEAAIDFRGQGILGGGVSIDAEIDVSVAGFFKYNQFSCSFEPNILPTPYACANEHLSEKAIANVFRCSESEIKEQCARALKTMRDAFQR